MIIKVYCLWQCILYADICSQKGAIMVRYMRLWGKKAFDFKYLIYKALAASLCFTIYLPESKCSKNHFDI